MDDAGEDAKALKETAGGNVVAPGEGSSVHQRKARLIQDHGLLRTSVWCGLVFSLALLLTVINLLPPAAVGYQVSTQLFVSPQRVEVLQRKLTAHAVPDFVPALGEPKLLSIHLLDHQAEATSTQLESLSEPLELVEVRSLWPSRTNSDDVQQWLNALSEPDQRVLSRVDFANAERFARWEAQVAEHYLKHFRHTRRNDGEADSSQEAATLVSTAEGLPTRFASLSSKPSTQAKPRAGATADEIEARLVQEYQRAAAREKFAAKVVEEQAAKLSGILTLAGSPHVRAQPERVPAPLVLSILVLACAGGAIGGWAHHRAQSGGTFYATEVARNMDVLGLPTLGVLRIAGAHLEGAAGDVHRRVTTLRRWATQKLLTVTELVVLFWCMAIAIRLVLDPLWRAMLWDNPLAALGRLFAGLP